MNQLAVESFIPQWFKKNSPPQILCYSFYKGKKYETKKKVVLTVYSVPAMERSRPVMILLWQLISQTSENKPAWKFAILWRLNWKFVSNVEMIILNFPDFIALYKKSPQHTFFFILLSYILTKNIRSTCYFWNLTVLYGNSSQEQSEFT